MGGQFCVGLYAGNTAGRAQCGRTDLHDAHPMSSPRALSRADARAALRRDFDRILDDRWPLAGRLLAAVDQYVERLRADD
jgi:hypothetical protein